jgi:hypothetical protein
MGLTSHLTSELWQKEQVFAESIAAKLWEVGAYEYATPLKECHTRETFCHCMDCGHVHSFKNRCDRFYCPMCCQALAYRRRLSVEAWAKTITQPKHVVLTARNTSSLSKTYVKWFKTGISKLRRLKCHAGWRGGLSSLEVTNEGKGWHLHAHILVDANWVDASHLSRAWGRLVCQDYAIVAVRDCREGTYLQEVTKYAVKGSELAKWSGMAAKCYIDSMQGIRQFSVFGSLFKDRAMRQTIADELAPGVSTCKSCESERLRYLDANEEDWLTETGKWPEKKWQR